MTVNYNPSIVTSGLVLALDAGNLKSYPGSGTSWTDLSGNANNGTLVNGPTYMSANGGGFTFNGTNQYGSTPLSLGGYNEYTVAAWVKTTTINKEIMATYGATNIFELWIGASGTLGAYIYGSNGVAYRQSATSINTGLWVYCVGVYSGLSNKLDTYVNGVLNNNTLTGTISSSLNSGASTVVIGNVNSGSYYFNGTIANTKIYNRALSAAEVLQNYNATYTRYQPISEQYVRSLSPAIWFDAADASTLYQSNGGALAAADGDPVGYWLDKSGNGLHAEQTTAGNKPILKLAAKNGKNALLFNGTTTSLSSASFSMPAMPSASRWAFFVVNITGTRCTLFVHGTSDTDENFGQWIGSDGYYSDIGTNTGPYVDITPSIGSGYRQFSMVWTRPTTTSILTAINNGVQTVPAITGGSTNTPNTNSVPFTLGKRGTNYFNSNVCELIYGSTVLTSDQIAGIHNYLNAKWAIY